MKSDEQCPIKRFNYLQSMIHHFWKRWSKEYLIDLQVRQKNNKECNNLQKGDLVYITYANIPPLYWPIGIIVETYTGNDDLVRVLKVKTGKEKFTVRPIVKLKKIQSESKLTFIGDPSSTAMHAGTGSCCPSQPSSFDTCVHGCQKLVYSRVVRRTVGVLQHTSPCPLL